MKPNSSSEPVSRKMLVSWKEISSFLEVDTKTAQRYEEKLGLPVHRRAGLLRSRVFAYTDELERWQNKKSNTGTRRKTTYRRLQRRFFLLALGVAALASSLVLIYIFITLPSQPYDFNIDQSTLIILDKSGRELWTHDTGLPNLWDEKLYREMFQRKKDVSDESRLLPVLIIKDIDGNRKCEVLFSAQTTDGLKGGILYYFDSHGTRLWQFEAGREIQIGPNKFSKDFVIVAVDVIDLNNDRDMEIFIIAHAREQVATQVVALNVKGDTLGEYWNIGQFNDYAFEDVNGDGKREMLLAGQNNAFDRPCLVILDIDSMSGFSPSKPSMECHDLGRGSEKYYLLFPLTELDKQFEPKTALCKIDILSNRRVQVRTTFSYVMYELNYLLKPASVTLSDTFIKRYQNGAREGKLKASLDERARELMRKELADGIEYYDGKSWSRRHAMSNIW